MIVLAKVSLITWALFAIAVASSLPHSPMRIYWLWLILGIAACASLVVAIRMRRKATTTIALAAALFLVTFGFYWVAMSTAVYHEASVLGRLENIGYVVVGNFKQGQVWLGLQTLYVQMLMPLAQIILLLGACLVGRLKGDSAAAHS